jgi:ADP-heptose:LPS heptosyltransferase
MTAPTAWTLPHTLVARLDSAGDVLLQGPAVRAVGAGSRRVTFLCGPRGRAAAELLPCVDRILSFRAEWVDPEPQPVSEAAVQELLATIREAAPDVAVILTSFHQSPLPLALLLKLAGVPRVGAVSEDYPGSLLDVRHRVEETATAQGPAGAPGGPHEVERSLSLVEAMGFSLPAADEGRLRVRRGGRLPPAVAAHRPYVVVHPGASVPARAWSPERHRALVELLVAAGRRVVVTGAADEAALTARVAPSRPEVLDAGGRTPWPVLAEVLGAADAVVVGNTGPAHLAAAVGTPVVSLFAPVVPAARWRPWGVPHVLLGDQEAACAGSRARACPIPGHPCLDQVTPAQAAEAVSALAPLPGVLAGVTPA